MHKWPDRMQCKMCLSSASIVQFKHSRDAQRINPALYLGRQSALPDCSRVQRQNIICLLRLHQSLHRICNASLAACRHMSTHCRYCSNSFLARLMSGPNQPWPGHLPMTNHMEPKAPDQAPTKATRTPLADLGHETSDGGVHPPGRTLETVSLYKNSCRPIGK